LLGKELNFSPEALQAPGDGWAQNAANDCELSLPVSAVSWPQDIQNLEAGGVLP